MRRTRYLVTAATTAVLIASPLGLVPAQANVPTYNIGDTGPGGGVVFITPSTTGNSTGSYFEARLSAVSLNACQYPNLPPRSITSNVTTATIGAGATNTAAIATMCEAASSGSDINDPGNSAFVWVGDQSFGGFSDWFIPNRDEISEFWSNRANPTLNPLFVGLTASPWISEATTADSNSTIYVLNTTTGGINSTSIPGGVRNFIVARAFNPSATDVERSPLPVLQQVGLLPGQRCADVVAPELNWAGVPSGGWSQSWAEWAVPVTGGSVCSRELFYDSSRSRWAVRS